MVDSAALARFLAKVDKETSPVFFNGTCCWIWAVNSPQRPYGAFWYQRTEWTAHRFSYTAFRGSIPPGLKLKHLCDNTRCVNPDHLQFLTAFERFFANVDKEDSPSFYAGSRCWIWTGPLLANGYGRTKYKKRSWLAHRLAYQLLVGELPAELQADHLCRNRRCVNPSHIEFVTQRTNMLRGEGLSARNARKTHCLRGHPYTDNNIRRHSDGSRSCRACEQRPEHKAARHIYYQLNKWRRPKGRH